MIKAEVEQIQAGVEAFGGQFRRSLTLEVTHFLATDEQSVRPHLQFFTPCRPLTRPGLSGALSARD